MSTPQQILQKGSRQSTKMLKADNSRSAMSENEAYSQSNLQPTPGGGGKNRQRRKSHAKKTNLNYDSATQSDGPAPRHAGQPVKTHATPIKSQAYAGPTFHQSPAASALPMPSFYSKSLPNAGIMHPVPENGPSLPYQAETQALPSPPMETKRETTPLDFLFDAARKAQATPGSESPRHQYLSPAIGKSPSRSPAPRDGDAVFPFEMDSTDGFLGEDNSTFSTPFKDRIEAARPITTTADRSRGLDEAERKAKTAALKSFLMNTAQNTEMADNPFNAKPAPPQNNYQRHHQQRSNPTTPMSGMYGNNYNQHYFPYVQMQNGHVSPRPPSSNLRNIYAPDTNFKSTEISSGDLQDHTPISTVREQTPVKRQYQGYYTPPQESPERSARPTPSAQQLEDDLRRVLKLDLVG